ncbi:PREDICTED: DDB1- and CUL4-associated factor 8 [Papilio xuthus]|uniref:DDB1- and CUL4-associated factor 8 n=2 Tax=Papilio xuthus TaxID=66420 RepID=A0AAJ7EKI5_PAPXU|nr:PREDICTED: DDB1- and CUL4-associated factor 8 [Papilio xuthus]
MEDNSSSDDEVNDSPASRKLSGKKIKLNDGTSQNSAKDAAAEGSNNKEEVVDSGISPDKSESTSSDDLLSASGPSNVVVNVGTSDNMVRVMMQNLRHHGRDRNYRKRKTPDSDESSTDSDDFSSEIRIVPDDNNDGDDMQHLLTIISQDTSSSSSNSSGSSSGSSNSSYSNYSFESDNVNFQPMDSSDDDGLWAHTPSINAALMENNEDLLGNNTEGLFGPPPKVLLKERPKHDYIIVREVINREMGLTFPCGKTAQSPMKFEQKFYGSLHAVYRLEKLHNLNKHHGCVNSINFHPEGHLLASGSDDMNVVVWDWARNRALQSIKTGHRANVFQSKFLYLNARSQLNIVTCSRDGQVRLVQCAPSGGNSGPGVARRRLATHARPAHKLHVSAQAPHEVISAGEDGLVLLADVRSNTPTKLVHVRRDGLTVPLYSVDVDCTGNKLLVAGRDRYMHVYDRRRPSAPAASYCPFHIAMMNNKKRQQPLNKHLTCAIYNHDGTKILGSYNDEDIYLIDTKQDEYIEDSDMSAEDAVGYRRRYTGHRNSATFKGVSFFGPRSQYVVSGSDCSYLYIWDTESEAIVQWLYADINGVVNSIEAHPRFPVLATSGLDRDVKIWVPIKQADPDYEGMEKVIRENSVTMRSPLFNDFLPAIYSAWREDNPHALGRNLDFDGNACTAF